jgi:single-stranded DNA-specific DHH superfamily exonuclease
MIPKKQINEIRKYLKKAENPLFFFDDDPDGLCSYLLLKKYIKRGKGVVVKATPYLDEKYKRKLDEYSPDFIFVLDMPNITQDFINLANVPIIWIDHHPPIERKGVHYYNPRLSKPKDYKPVSYYCYKITKKNLWIATVGSVADCHIPEFINEFSKKYPELIKKPTSSVRELNFNTKLGELIRIFSFLLMGRTSEVNKRINILTKINEPKEILEQTTPKGSFIVKKTKKVRKNYNKLLKNALSEIKEEKICIYIYTGKDSFTSELVDELIYRKKCEVMIVGREKNDEIKISIRSNKIKLLKIIKKALSGLGGYGGGHDYATGCNIAKKDFGLFIERFKELVK